MARFTSSAIIVRRFICFSCFLEEILVRLCSPPTRTVGNGPPNPATFIVYLLMPGGERGIYPRAHGRNHKVFEGLGGRAITAPVRSQGARMTGTPAHGPP